MHPNWKLRLLLFAIGMVGISPTLAMGAPHIDSAYPPAFVQEASGVQSVSLRGSNLAAPDTTGYTIDKDVQVYMRDSWGTFQLARQTGWLKSQADVEFPSNPWLLKPGILEFKVVVRGVESNIFQVPIHPLPTEPPVLSQVVPSSIVIDPKADNFHYIVKVFGKNIDSSTYMTIDELQGEYQLQAPGLGWVQAQVPRPLRSKPGFYVVKITNKVGTSNLGMLEMKPLGFIGTFAKTPPHYQPLWIYGIRPNGELIWYRKDSNASVWQGPKTVGTGWNSFKDVIPAGGNCFFALAQDGKLLWYRHDGFNDGSFTWPKPVEVGNGWAFSRIFSGGQGIVYAIKSDGTLLWYRNNDNLNGSREWQGPKVVGSGWNQFKDVFSTGQGTIYAVRSDGRLSLYRHDGYATGEAKWQQDRVVGTGWNSFKQIVPSSDGVILAILPDGKMVWYKHLGLTAPLRIGKLKETWEGPVEIGSGWHDFQKVIALIPDPPVAVR